VRALADRTGVEVFDSDDFADVASYADAVRDFIVRRKYIDKRRAFFGGKKLIVAGAGERSRALTHPEFYDRVAYFIDADKTKTGAALFGKPVYGFEAIAKESKDDTFVIINAKFRYYRAMADALKGFGWEEKIHFSSIEDFCQKTDTEDYITCSFEFLEKNGIFDINTNRHLWNDRTELLSQFIAWDARSIVEFGCGRCILKSFLPAGVAYTGVDYVKRDEDTIVCDVNRDPLPDIKADTLFLAGFIEEVKDVRSFFRYASQRCKQMVMSYHPLELRTGWGYKLGEYRDAANYLTSPELIALVQENGFLLKRSKQCYFARSQMLFDFRTANGG
jgi:hypothetical protein